MTAAFFNLLIETFEFEPLELEPLEPPPPPFQKKQWFRYEQDRTCECGTMN